MIREGKWKEGAFIYQSCSGNLFSGHGSFGGRLRFVPGTLAAPLGPAFDVIVGRFPMEIPEFFF